MEEGNNSALLMVTNKCTVEGFRSSCAMVSTHKSSHDSPSAMLPQRKYEVSLRMAGVSMYTVPTDLEGEDARVYWRVPGPIGPVDAAASNPEDDQQGSLLKYLLESGDTAAAPPPTPAKDQTSPLQVAVQDFEVAAAYEFYVDVTVGEAVGMVLEESPVEFVCRFVLDLPELCIDVDSTQFFMISNVVRHVLLAPPPPFVPPPVPVVSSNISNHVVRMETRKPANSASEWKAAADESSNIQASRTESRRRSRGKVKSTNGGPDLKTKFGREEMLRLVECVQQQQLERGAPLTADKRPPQRLGREVKFSVGLVQWFMKSSTSQKDSDNLGVEIGFMGLAGSHLLQGDRGSSSHFEIQRFWAYNHRPVVEATKFADPTLLIATAHHEEVVCVRCGEPFVPRENKRNSCCSHSGAIVHSSECDSGRTGLHGSVGRIWSCCGRPASSKGCVSRAHDCQEVTVSARCDAGSPFTVGCSQDVANLDMMEFSLFRQVEVQVTKSLVEFLHAYFVIEKDSAGDLAASEPEKAPLIGSVMRRTNSNADNVRLFGSEKDNSTILKQPNSNTADTALMTGSPIAHRRGSSNTPSADTSGKFGAKEDGSGTRLKRSGSNADVVVRNAAPAPVLEQKARAEAIYLKCLRVGQFDVVVSTAGFPVNLSNYKAMIEPYMQQHKIVTWPHLIRKLEHHAAWSVTKHTAENSFKKLRHLFWGHASTKDEEHPEAKIASLLGRPR